MAVGVNVGMRGRLFVFVLWWTSDSHPVLARIGSTPHDPPQNKE